VGDPGEPRDQLSRLDPDRAAESSPAPGPAPAPVRSVRAATRRSQLLIGLIALALVLAFSIDRLSTHSGATAGIPAGRPLRAFAAPLAGTTLVGDANLRPPCTEASHDPRALNVCLLLRRGPLVLGFFVLGARPCEQSVSALQADAPAFAARGIQVAAVAVSAAPRAAARAVRRHGWTIPVAYDRDGAVGESYGVAVCPLLELARPGGTVAARLIGQRWASPVALAAAVRRLLG
jgi:hypothetical protein